MIDSVFDFDADSGDEEMRPNTNPEPQPRSQSLLASAFDQMTEEDKAEMLKLLVPPRREQSVKAKKAPIISLFGKFKKNNDIKKGS